jgi:hypothetical protein
MPLPRRLSVISFAFLVIVAAASAIFVHQVSPLRDVTFEPNSGNAGSLVPWLQDVSESDWLHGATVLAALLSSSLLLVLRPYGLRKIAAFLSGAKWIFVGISLCLVGLFFSQLLQYLPSSVAMAAIMGSYMSLFAAIAGFYAAFTLWLQNRFDNPDRGHRIASKMKRVLKFTHWIGLGSLFFVQIWLVYFSYLLEQHLLD